MGSAATDNDNSFLLNLPTNQQHRQQFTTATDAANINNNK